MRESLKFQKEKNKTVPVTISAKLKADKSGNSNHEITKAAMPSATDKP